MARILITEFMNEAAVARLRAAHEVRYDPGLAAQPELLLAQAVCAVDFVLDGHVDELADVEVFQIG